MSLISAEPQAIPEVQLRPSQQAYRRFKEALFARRIEAGSIVNQAELVAVTGVPITALREALQLLEVEGLVRILPRAGIQIAKPDLAMVRNSFQMRLFLEVPAVRHAAEAMPKKDLTALLARHEAMLERTATVEVTAEVAAEASSVDLGLHLAIIGHLSNPLVERAYRQAHDHIRLIRLDQLFMLSAAAIGRTMQEHIALLRACLARDPETAVAALELHFAKAMQRALGV